MYLREDKALQLQLKTSVGEDGLALEDGIGAIDDGAASVDNGGDGTEQAEPIARILRTHLKQAGTHFLTYVCLYFFFAQLDMWLLAIGHWFLSY